MMGFEIIRAENGGFFVRKTISQNGYYNPILLAGTFDECVDFIRKNFSEDQA